MTAFAIGVLAGLVAGLTLGTVLATLAEGGWHRRTEVAEVTPEPSNVRVLRDGGDLPMQDWERALIDPEFDRQWRGGAS